TITAHRIVAYLQDEIIEGYSHPDTERATMTVYSEGGVQMPTLDATPWPSPTPDPAAAEDDEEASPIVIVADQLTLNNPEQLATYTGDVEATQKATQIFSDEMYVYIVETEDGGNDVEKIEVMGNVRILHENTTVTGDSGVYITSDQYALVEGTSKQKARAEDTIQNMVLEAPVIEADLATNTIKARGVTTVLDNQAQETQEQETQDQETQKPEGGTRVRTVIGTDEEAEQPDAEADTPTPTPEPDNETKADPDRPSVTLYPNSQS
ncbi:hypothetical protein GF339_18960, partial [candidate division KSB3 bacterium]|nr:hypothetical protein [candidate division KSB3 bacterium]MBD3326672.1 hypothetical protein [candidate division KSB3 bacterium]